MTDLMFPHDVPATEPPEGSVILVRGSYPSGAGYGGHIRIRVGDEWRTDPTSSYNARTWPQLTDLSVINAEKRGSVVAAVNVLIINSPPVPAHEFTGTVKRADGVTITATLSVPDTHPMAQPGPHRPWHGPDRPNQNFLELGELAMMIAQRGYGIIESNERSREHWGRQDYWADLLNITPPTPELEGPKEDVVFLVGKELPGER